MLPLTFAGGRQTYRVGARAAPRPAAPPPANEHERRHGVHALVEPERDHAPPPSVAPPDQPNEPASRATIISP
jgi:hypothetical protein